MGLGSMFNPNGFITGQPSGMMGDTLKALEEQNKTLATSQAVQPAQINAVEQQKSLSPTNQVNQGVYTPYQMTNYGDAFKPIDQSALAKQAFETAVQPLRSEFGKTLDTTTENLAKRGIAFGGLGNQAYSNLLQKQSELEAGIAGQIGTQLGMSALDKAFQANEAAKNRQLQEKMQQSGFQFERGTQAAQLGAQGILGGQALQNQLASAFGPGVKFSTQDEVDLQRVAQASGLSTEDYTRMRQAIGQGQLQDVMNNPQQYIQNPEAAKQFQLKLAQIQADAVKASAKSQADAANTNALGQAVGAAVPMLISMFSDERLKEEVEPITDALEVIESLNPVEFKWKEDGRKDYGVIAQEIEEVLPELVDNSGEYKKVNYMGLIGILISGMQDLIERVGELEAKNG